VAGALRARRQLSTDQVRARRDLVLQAMAGTRRRLLARRAIREPDPALAGRRHVAGRDIDGGAMTWLAVGRRAVGRAAGERQHGT
jgi:hypothetical protein